MNGFVKRVVGVALVSMLGLAGAAHAEDAVRAPATVEVTSPDGDVTVAAIVGRASGTGSTSAGTVTVHSTYYDDICIAPCSFEAEDGMMELLIYKSGRVGANQKVQFQSGESYTLDADLAPALPKTAGRYLWIAGSAALLGGLTLTAMNPDSPGNGALLAGAGAGGMAVGLPLDLLFRSKINLKKR